MDGCPSLSATRTKPARRRERGGGTLIPSAPRFHFAIHGNCHFPPVPLRPPVTVSSPPKNSPGTYLIVRRSKPNYQQFEELKAGVLFLAAGGFLAEWNSGSSCSGQCFLGLDSGTRRFLRVARSKARNWVAQIGAFVGSLPRILGQATRVTPKALFAEM